MLLRGKKLFDGRTLILCFKVFFNSGSEVIAYLFGKQFALYSII